jgi:hypothetical protein
MAVGLACALCFGLTACDPEDVVGARFTATRADSVAFPAAGIPILEIESSNGAVDVRGVPGQTEVRVTATVTSRGSTQAQANERVAAVSLRMAQQGGRILLAYRASEQAEDVRRYTGVAFEVTAPPGLDVRAATSNGAISAASVQGRLHLTTSNGAIDASDAIGQLRAVTSNGRIHAARCQGTLDLETSNGEIAMEDVSATVDAHTSNGAIAFSGTLIGPANSLETSNGRIRLAVPGTASLEIAAKTSSASISSALPLVGDTQGKEWLATLNPPATAAVSLATSNGAIEVLPRP